MHGAQPANVDTVVVDGRILKRAGQFTALDPEQVVRAAAESLAVARSTRFGCHRGEQVVRAAAESLAGLHARAGTA